MQSQLKDARTQIGKKCDDELLFNDVIACLAATGSKKITSIFPSQASRIISSSSSNNTNDIPSSSLNEPDIMPVFDVNIDKK
ncbi:11073_t:CDS:2 [Entrophospora sp. SA101]|nr:11073_t:CDS:2 [Entrophospora sp. SA101]